MRASTLAFLAAFCFASIANAQLPHRADAGAAVRRGNKIDVEATVLALSAMHCDGYLYDLPHGTDAWDKLPAFADAAARQKIDVWVYLPPWTLAHRGNRNEEPEPFGTDYQRWCTEIGTLAKSHPNIRGVVMDDFQSNTTGDDKFTPQSVRDLRAALQQGRRDLAFVPVLYFDLPVPMLLESFGKAFADGAILAYPRGRREVETMQRELNDDARGAAFSVELPRKHRLHPGDGTFAGTALPHEIARRAARLQFLLDDQNATTRRGRHRIVVRVDGKIVWSKELAGTSVAGEVDAPLGRLRDGSRVEVGIIADEPSEEAVVHINCSDVLFVDADGAPDHSVSWRHDVDDGIRFDIVQPQRGQNRWKVPMTLLVSGAAFEHEIRFKEPGTPENIAGRTKQAVDWCGLGLANGVVTWFAPLADGPEITQGIGNVFATK